MTRKNILLLCGGGSSEHEVSLVSANFIQEQLKFNRDFNVIRVEILGDEWILASGIKTNFDIVRAELLGEGHQFTIDYVVPCLHGYPGETGDIQSLLELAKIPYLGCGPEASANSFNKITSKLWYDALNIPNTPYLFLSSQCETSYEKAEKALDKWNSVFIKAARQGSSVGCYRVTNKSQLDDAIIKSFSFSDQVLIEKALQPRELELAVFEYNGEVIITKPSEIIAPKNGFYTYEEKYGSDSHSLTEIEAKNLTDEQIGEMHSYAKKVFNQMGLKDLCRIDFFLTQDDEIYLNEVNTFPGMTPSSLFPKMIEHHGINFIDFLNETIKKSLC